MERRGSLSRAAPARPRRTSTDFFSRYTKLNVVPRLSANAFAEGKSKLASGIKRIYNYRLLISLLESRNRAQIEAAAAQLHSECQRPDRAQILQECGVVPALGRLLMLEATTDAGKRMVMQSLQDLCTLSLNEDCAQEIRQSETLMLQLDHLLHTTERSVLVGLAARTVCRLVRPHSPVDPLPRVDTPLFDIVLELLTLPVHAAKVEGLVLLDELTQDVDFVDALCEPTADVRAGERVIGRLVALLESEQIDVAYGAVRVLRNIVCNVHSSDNIFTSVRTVAEESAKAKLVHMAQRSGLLVLEGNPADGVPEGRDTLHARGMRGSTVTFNSEARKKRLPSVETSNDIAAMRSQSVRESEEICMGEAAMECLWYMGTVYSRASTKGNQPEDGYASMYAAALSGEH